MITGVLNAGNSNWVLVCVRHVTMSWTLTFDPSARHIVSVWPVPPCVLLRLAHFQPAAKTKLESVSRTLSQKKNQFGCYVC